MDEYIYLDNNANTKVIKSVLDTYIKYVNIGNPSGNNAIAQAVQAKIEKAKKIIASVCGFSLEDYSIIFTSGATESNNFIIRSIADSCQAKQIKRPNIIISNIEHKSIIQCCRDLEEQGRISYTMLPVERSGRYYGKINPRTLKLAIDDNTMLVCIMGANNENGAINDLIDLSEVCKAKNVPFFSDCVQLFPRYIVNPLKLGLSAFSVSFHKLHSMIGSGMLVIENSLLHDQCLKSQLAGSDPLRSGTLPAALILASTTAIIEISSNRAQKNELLLKKRNLIINGISKYLRLTYLDDYVYKYIDDSKIKANPIKHIQIILCMNKQSSLVNTIYLAIDRPGCCNTAIQNHLEKCKIIIGLGSACNKKEASYVAVNCGVPDELINTMVRITLSDLTTEKECLMFIKCFIDIVSSYKCLTDEYATQFGYQLS